MSMQSPEWWLLDERQPVALAELARMCGMSPQDLVELVEYGTLVPCAGTGADATFTADYVHPLREAARVRAMFDLDLFTVGLVTGYLHRIEVLEQRLRAVQGQLPAHVPRERDGPALWREAHG
ncbi:MAG: hypothetical protein HY854_16470 [Burkholderiales bacterium]|nr:hypothetical protein [Burkholderiales bacterium]